VTRRRRRLGVAVLVYDIDTTGGMQRQALDLAERLARRGANVHVFSYCAIPGLVPRLPRGVPLLERHGRLRIWRIPHVKGWGYEAAMQFFEIAVAFALFPRASSLDAIYAVQWTGGVHGARLAALLGLPLFVKFTGGGAFGDVAALERVPGGRAATALLARADRIVCISPEIEEEARGLGFEPARFLRIPNGVDVERFARATPAELPGPEGERLLFVGALRREKRLPELLRAFARVAAARPRARLFIAGDGSERASAEAMARELNLGEKVTFLGDRRDVPELLAAADAFVLTSESEGLSNAILEALAAGLPIVASDIPGNRHLLTNEREALLVPHDGALAAAIERVLADRALAERLGRAARARAGEYAFERVVALYEGAFDAASRPAPGSAVLLWRYCASFENPGLANLSWRGARYFGRWARPRIKKLRPLPRMAVTSVVVFLKGLFGIERNILKRPAAGARAP
jgi:glycosyltransferase involved in cell wall biosynthesis